ncbi:MAG TPA: hypothetical protein VKV38_00985 [Trebonia sp.]|jgi:hypothetical protein|nr:hypothetical protein [Trebonia sp.]
MTAEFLWINIPLMVLAFALWVGVPMWMVLRHPDRHPRETRTVPVYLRQRGMVPAADAAREPGSAREPGYERDDAGRRELVSASR